jgi:hypothetical protein
MKTAMKYFTASLVAGKKWLFASMFTVTALVTLAPGQAYAQKTQSAEQCVAQRNFLVGSITDNGLYMFDSHTAQSFQVWPYNVARFYNTCGPTVNMFVVASNGANTFGAVGSGAFVVMSDESSFGAPILPTKFFACTYPGKPTAVRGRGWPTFSDSTYECH